MQIPAVRNNSYLFSIKPKYTIHCTTLGLGLLSETDISIPGRHETTSCYPQKIKYDTFLFEFNSDCASSTSATSVNLQQRGLCHHKDNSLVADGIYDVVMIFSTTLTPKSLYAVCPDNICQMHTSSLRATATRTLSLFFFLTWV